MPRLSPQLYASILACCAGGLLPACSSDPSGDVPAPQRGSETGAALELQADPSSERAPEIFAEQASFDFGGVSADGSVEHVFKVGNRGDAELRILRVQKT